MTAYTERAKNVHVASMVKILVSWVLGVEISQESAPSYSLSLSFSLSDSRITNLSIWQASSGRMGFALRLTGTVLGALGTRGKGGGRAVRRRGGERLGATRREGRAGSKQNVP